MAYKFNLIEVQIIITIIGLILICLKADDDTITVHLPFGSIRGYSNGHSWQFNGIPYAEPPVGKLRWKAPENFTSWRDTLDAKEPPAGCPQICTFPFACPMKISEDCLYLNVYVPLEWNPKSSKRYNVLVFIHGGGFIKGTSGCLLFDSRFLSQNIDSIIVTLNYRLGALGFVRQNKFGILGNMGLKDQRKAMQWVRSYISYFGGYKNVTLFGESAGAISVGIHMVVPLSEGLFDAVILESNLWTCPLKNITRAEQLGSEFVKNLKCDDENCMYAKTAEEIIQAQSQTSLSCDFVDMVVWAPIIDNIELSEQPYSALINGANKKLKSSLTSAIMGTNTAEGLLFVGDLNITKSMFEQLINTAFIDNSLAVIKLYSSLYNASEGYAGLLAQIMTDYTFYCSTRNATRTLAITFMDDPLKKVWEYVWGQSVDLHINNACINQPCHSFEIPYLFDSGSLYGLNFSKGESNLANQIEQYWGNFAKSANPNMNNQSAAKLLYWENYDIKSGSQLFFVVPNNKIISNYRGKYCDFWDTIGYVRDDCSSTASQQHSKGILEDTNMKKNDFDKNRVKI